MKNNIKLQRLVFLCVLTVSIFFCVAFAQTEDSYPEYTIQEGDFLSIVAQTFSTTVDDILTINAIENLNAISIGTVIKIPSLKGLSGIISAQNLNIGDSLRTLSMINHLPQSKIALINKLISPSQAYIGSTLVIVSSDQELALSAKDFFKTEDTLLEKAVSNQINPQMVLKINEMKGSWDVQENLLLFMHGDSSTAVRTVSPMIDELSFKPVPVTQGETHVLKLTSNRNLTLSGRIGEQDLRFFSEEDRPNSYYAMIGINAMTDPGLMNFSIQGQSQDGEQFFVDQQVVIQKKIVLDEVVEGVAQETLEDDNNSADAGVVASLTATSANRSWGQAMSYPVDEPCFASGFGNRRVYNSGDYKNYHTGVDFSICKADNINIYAAADGSIIYADELPIHGKFTVIDHGWGVYTTYSHQSQISVSAGETIKRGQFIGLIGNTGRSVGPHLHWEVLVNSVYVNPLTWTNTVFP